MSLNALSGIGGVQTGRHTGHTTPAGDGLNALSGIGGVQTELAVHIDMRDKTVLMPCRALEAFRPKH